MKTTVRQPEGAEPCTETNFLEIVERIKSWENVNPTIDLLRDPFRGFQNPLEDRIEPVECLTLRITISLEGQAKPIPATLIFRQSGEYGRPYTYRDDAGMEIWPVGLQIDEEFIPKKPKCV